MILTILGLIQYFYAKFGVNFVLAAVSDLPALCRFWLMVSLPAFITYQYFTQLQLPAQNIVYINMLDIINFPN
ncbi:hypothetical protein BGI12_01625 [Snodgrassella alvi]|nr:hypothetical protein BGI12_01625 [Snodgrassella alvi]